MKVLLTEQQITDIIQNYTDKLKSIPLNDIGLDKKIPNILNLTKLLQGGDVSQLGPVTKNDASPEDGISLVSDDMMHPLGPNGQQYKISSVYGPRVSPVDKTSGKLGSSNHQAVDIAVPSGSHLPVFAPLDGVIVAARDTYPNACGGEIQINHGNIQTRFCHLSKFYVNTGQNVKKGQQIGLTGGGTDDPMRGTSTDSHLHYAILHSDGLTAYNPTQIQKNLA